MRKVLYLFTLLGLIANVAKAQIVVNHGASGPNNVTQNYFGTNVNVQRFGTAGQNNICGAGPYFIGQNSSNSYRFTFNAPVTHVILSFSRVHSNDEVAIRVNGNPITLTAGQINAFPGTCTLPNNGIATVNGYLSSTIAQSFTTIDGAGAEVTVTNPVLPYSITTLDVEHVTGAPNVGGVVFSVAFKANDTCNLPFQITASDSTPCSNRCLFLEAPNFPNTTFTWGSIGIPVAFPQPGNKMDTFHQRICPVTILHKGTFTVHAERGACVWDDQIYIDPKNTPSPIIVSRPLFPNGICRGAKDSLQATAPLGGGGEYYWYRKNPSQNIKGVPTPVYSTTLGFVTIEDFNTTDEGEYCAYAVSANDFCATDTACLNVFMLPDVVADFDVTPLFQACETDTAWVENLSRGATNGYIWRIWDYKNQTTGNLGALLTIRNDDTNFKQTYIVPKPNNFANPREYVIELVAMNVACRDSVKDSVKFHHPLTAGFKVNKDMVCQGKEVDTVFITDTTTASVSGLHQYLWSFGEPGAPTSTNDNGLKWLYTKTGTWRIMLKVTDFQGCIDSAWHDIFVDSTGPLFFTTSDTVICSGKQVEFVGDLNRVGLTESFWDFGLAGLQLRDTNYAVFNYDKPGTYTVSFNAKYRVCPEAKSEVTVRVKPFPKISVGPDTTMCQYGQPIKLWDRVNHPLAEGLKWHWNTPSGKENGPSLIVRHPGVYSATVTLDGCSTTDSVTVAKNCYLDIPNVFTPDGDGNNDYFLPRQLMGRSVNNFKMSVFNRWGQKVFETSSINGRGWDGNFNAEKQPNGVYVYQLEVGFSDNASRLEKYEGNVTLLR